MGCGRPVFDQYSLISALQGADWSASRPDRFPTMKEPHYKLDMGPAEPRSCLDIFEKRNISCPCQEWNPYLLAVHTVS
jgi:hypothetical protein